MIRKEPDAGCSEGIGGCGQTQCVASVCSLLNCAGVLMLGPKSGWCVEETRGLKGVSLECLQVEVVTCTRVSRKHCPEAC